MSNIILTALLVIFCCSSILTQDNSNSYTVTFLFLVLMCQNIYYLNFRGGANFNCYKVYFVFSFIFMAFIPYLHFAAGKVFWGAPQPSINDYIYTLSALLCFNFIFAFTYNYNLNLSNTKYLNFKSELKFDKDSLFVLLIVLTLLVLTISHVLKHISNPLSLLLRVESDQLVEWNSSNQPILLIINRFTLFFPLFAALFIGKYVDSLKLKTLTLICLLICAFPLAISRYAVAGIYLPILFFYFPRLLIGRKMQYMMIFSICTIFPFLDQFRKFDPDSKINILPSVDFFYYPHFDAFQNLLSSLSSNFITYGYQLLGSIFFFIPRLIWPSKPVGSGAQLAINQDYFFANISMPLVGEAYINFGVLGIFFVPLLLGVTIRKLDTGFWNSQYRNSDLELFYIYLLGYFTFILRGDLLSSWAYFCAGIFSYFLINFFKKLKVKI